MASRAFQHDHLILIVDVAAEIAAAVRVLARHRNGAIMTWNPATTVDGGIVLDARVSRELVAIFVPEYVNRLHAGVVVIRGGRIERAGVPIAWAEIVTRANELASGVAIEVNEDTGEIRIADRMGRVGVVDADDLAVVLRGHPLEAGPR